MWVAWPAVGQALRIPPPWVLRIRPRIDSPRGERDLAGDGKGSVHYLGGLTRRLFLGEPMIR